ncbi:hypothetical protein Sjap_014572 [Stephania japonica]|uniref:Arf-GAP domain-containing protein n=1 Tax=Stephania japonica TaxID=461633 RepID=A0AAP0IHY1_9MAGN
MAAEPSPGLRILLHQHQKDRAPVHISSHADRDRVLEIFKGALSRSGLPSEFAWQTVQDAIKPQAENEADRMDWVDKIRGVIASLLQSPFLEQHRTGHEDAPVRGYAYGSGRDLSVGDVYRRLEDDTIKGQDDALRILREISGNDLCAECGAPDPDWASLNLGILLCIGCSGAHRNLGVHISKVRSITLDVKVWESTVLDLFRGLGNAYCNSVWEEMLQHQHERTNESDSLLLITKLGPTDPVAKKEKYIQAKYVEKLFVNREATDSEVPSSAARIWEAVKSKDIREVYHLIVVSDANINTSYDEVDGCDLCHLQSTAEFQNGLKTSDKSRYDPALCQRIKESNDSASCLQGWSLLHLACHNDDWVMVELLLLFGADINKCDFHGRTPLHHCVSRGNNSLAKYLLRRGARSSLKDGGGLTALERAMERGAITDERLFILLTERE